jgi:putative flippase GtrA
MPRTDIAMAEPGTQKDLHMCAVCGEWISSEELSRHDQTAHPEIQRVIAKAMRRLALTAVAAGLGLILVLVFYNGLTTSSRQFRIALWATWMVFFGTIPVFVVAMKHTRKAYDETLFRCWVCDTRVPHRDLPAHLREFHRADAKEYFLSKIIVYAIFGIGTPIAGLMLIVSLLDPSLSPLLGIGPIAGLVVSMIPVAVYASRWPRRIARSRREWEALHSTSANERT